MKLTLEEMYSGVEKTIKYKRNKPCKVCRAPKDCANCSGKGWTLEESIEEIKIPEGIDKGMVVKYKDKGHYFVEKKKVWQLFSRQKNESKNNFGNLIINFEEIKHDVFSRDKSDLIYSCRIKQSELNEADIKIEFQHLNNEIMKILIPKNTVDGKIFRIREKGFKNIGNNQTGSLLIATKIIEG